jgi:hypothetical protein
VNTRPYMNGWIDPHPSVHSLDPSDCCDQAAAERGLEVMFECHVHEKTEIYKKTHAVELNRKEAAQPWRGLGVCRYHCRCVHRFSLSWGCRRASTCLSWCRRPTLHTCACAKRTDHSTHEDLRRIFKSCTRPGGIACDGMKSGRSDVCACVCVCVCVCVAK